MQPAAPLMQMLDRVDALKSQAPILGTPRDPDYAAAAEASLPEASLPLEAVIPQLVHALDGMLITAHPRSQVNVVGSPSIASVIGSILPSMYNPNLCSDESGRGFSERRHIHSRALCASPGPRWAVRGGGRPSVR